MTNTRRETSTIGNEVFFGLVGAVGTELEKVSAALDRSLARFAYTSSKIRLAALLRDLPKYKSLPTRFIDEYIDSHMTAGDEFRRIMESDDAVAILGVGAIKDVRLGSGSPTEGLPNRAFILRSLKNPAEVNSLRQIYGSSFYLIAAYSPLSSRRTHLAVRIAKSRNEFPYDRHFPVTDRLILRDQEEIDTPHGQNTRDCFHRADVFVDMASTDKLNSSIDRFLELVFGNTFRTPTRDEFAMFHAQAAALRSAELGRQVGAAIATRDGDIVAVGCNEVPKAGGGLYWCDDDPDRREFQEGSDTNDEQKRSLIAETLKNLQKAGWLAKRQASLPIDELLREALDPKSPALPKDSKIRHLIEFGRAVHAEMAAISDAARRGVSIANCTMYVTTFPCHLCARHIVAAGITKLIYVEPYAKSLTAELYPDSVSVDEGSATGKYVPFLPFVGVAPRQYMNLFSMGKRKNADGSAFLFSPKAARLRYFEVSSIYLENEVKSFKNLSDKMKLKRIF